MHCTHRCLFQSVCRSVHVGNLVDEEGAYEEAVEKCRVFSFIGLLAYLPLPGTGEEVFVSKRLFSP